MGLKEKIGHSSPGTFSSIIVRSSFLLMKKVCATICINLKYLKNLTFNIDQVKMKKIKLKGELEICLQAYSGFL